MLLKNRFIISVLFFCAVLFYAGSLAAAQIEKVNFLQEGENKLPEDMLSLNMQQKAGAQFDEKILNEDIKRLYSTGFFSDVVSETSSTSSGKVIITIKVTPRAQIKTIRFEGNKKFDSEKLSKEITLVTEQPLSDGKLRESTSKLRKFYMSEGYNDAQINPKVTEIDKGYLDVCFNIDEKLKAKINNVTFEGNTVYSGWKLRHTIANQYSYLNWILGTGLLNKNEFANDKLRLRELYWNKGYLDFKVDDIKVTEEEDPEWVDLDIKLTEGEPYKIGTVTISGNKEFTSDQLLEILTMKSGEVYDNRKEKSDADAIADRYASLGYADFSCRAVRVPDYKTHTVAIEYQLKEGSIYTVRDVRISGNTITKDYVIRRELAIQPGDPVDKNRIEASKSRLMGMGYFEEVEALTSASGEASQKDVDFNVKEKNTTSFKVGGGYSDVNSLEGMVELSQNNFDITDPENYFQGGGQRARAQALFGLTSYGFNINFMEPWLFGIPLKWDTTGYLTNNTYEHWQEQRLGIKTQLSKKFFDDFTTFSTGYKFERVKVYKMDDWLTQDFLDQEKAELVGATNFGVTRDTRDSLSDPTSGYILGAFSELSSRALGGDHNYYRLESKGSHFYSIFDKAIIFNTRGKIGTVSDFNRDNMVPLYERYFLGGSDTIRGFPWRNVSPTTDVAGDPIASGGQSMMIVSEEVTHPIWNFIRGAVFCDAGNAWRNTYSYGFSGINAGAGYGLRIKIPYMNAPIAVDLAYPILNRQDGYNSKWRVHFNMGFTW